MEVPIRLVLKHAVGFALIETAVIGMFLGLAGFSRHMANKGIHYNKSQRQFG